MNKIKRIELGETGFRHKQIPAITFESEVYALNYATGRDLKSKPGDVSEFDTRLTVEEVFREICRREQLRASTPDEDIYDYDDLVGPIDEYFHISRDFKRNDKFPANWCWIPCYLVMGGSEGIYLHVDIVLYSKGEHERKSLFLGKTLNTSQEQWFKMFESAAYISAYLQLYNN